MAGTGGFVDFFPFIEDEFTAQKVLTKTCKWLHEF
jgi:hypothetical protein